MGWEGRPLDAARRLRSGLTRLQQTLVQEVFMRDDEEIDPMGWRLARSVVRGEIDSRVRDTVRGRLWLIDRKFPIELIFKGNPLRDLAGCLLTFENPEPEAEDNEGLCPIQMGRTGNITASMKVHVYDATPEVVEELQRRGEPVKRQVSNALSIEWYSNANGRVVLETTGFRLKISEYAWRMSKEDEDIQLLKNQESGNRWAEIVADEDEDDDLDLEDFDDSPDWYMNEFDWERQLQESDAMTARYMELIEAFLDHPDRERMIAHEMGWDGLEDALDDDDGDLVFDVDDVLDWDEMDGDDFVPLEPIPQSEGKDWIRGRDGKVRHPLTERATILSMSIWRCCKEHGITGNSGGDPDIHNLLFHAQTLSAKLSGALDGLAYDDDPDGGFVVACLKRTLRHFGQAINATGIVSQKHLLPAASLKSFRDDFFGIRQEILTLMQHYRQII